MDYIINPVMMGGLVKEVSPEGMVHINLHGRLGVIKVPRRLVRYDGELLPGHELSFYFSYIQIKDEMLDYDASDMNPDHDLFPCLLGGKLTEVNDTAIVVEIMNGLGSIAVPRRWAFTPVFLEEGQTAEFYMSCMDVVGKRKLPFEAN